MEDKQIKKVARVICKLKGWDPDENVEQVIPSLRISPVKIFKDEQVCLWICGHIKMEELDEQPRRQET